MSTLVRFSRPAHVKPCIDCARLPRETMFVALPRKVDTMLLRTAERTLPRANLARVEPNRSGSLTRGNGISVCCARSVETVVWCSNSVDQQPRSMLGKHEHGYQHTNERVCRARTAARGSHAQSIPGLMHAQRHASNQLNGAVFSDARSSARTSTSSGFLFNIPCNLPCRQNKHYYLLKIIGHIVPYGTLQTKIIQTN